MADALQVAVITGGHLFDVIEFQKLWWSLGGVQAFVQHIDDFCGSADATRAAYDAVVFYTMPPGRPVGSHEVLARLGEDGRGVVLLHHGILAYPDWAAWGELVGIPDRSFHGYHHDRMLTVRVEAPEHPITAGLLPWCLVDETYDMANPEPGNHLLLSLEGQEPGTMTQVAWTRTHGRSRVFCLQLGHDARCWRDAGFRRVLGNGLFWAAGRGSGG